MAKSTDLFYSNAAEFQSKRKNVMDTYEKRIAELEPTKGSQYYTLETQKAIQTRDAALLSLRNEYSTKINVILNAMAETNEKRDIAPPTAEQLAVLQTLKMRENITRVDLDRAAKYCRGNALAMSVINEIASKNLLPRYHGKMGADEAESIINGLRRSISDFLQYDTPKAARIAANYYETVYGNTGNGQNLQKRPLFSDKDGCFHALLNMDKETCAAFCDAVDAAGE